MQTQKSERHAERSKDVGQASCLPIARFANRLKAIATDLLPILQIPLIMSKTLSVPLPFPSRKGDPSMGLPEALGGKRFTNAPALIELIGP